MRLLDRYVLREFVWPFVGCVAGFTVILVSGLLFELADLILVKQVAWHVVLRMLVYRLPGLVTVAVPVGTLFGVILALGRLERDGELTVVRGAGVPFWRVTVWLMAAALVVSGVTYLISEHVVPWTNHEYEKLVRQVLFNDPVPAVRERVFFKDAHDNVFYVREVDTGQRRLVDVMIYQLEERAFPRLITARSGTYADNVWYLEDVVTREVGPDGFIEREVRAETLAFPMREGSEAFFGNQRTTDEMSRKELAEHIRLFQRSGIDVRPFLVDYHMKLALPFASMVLSLLAAPLSLWGGRHGWVFGLGASVALAFFYYTLMALFRSLGANGVLPPIAAVWAGNVVFAGVGVWLFVRADRVGSPFR